MPYFHVVFTLPAPIASFAYQNKAAIYGILFKASAETIRLPSRLNEALNTLSTWPFIEAIKRPLREFHSRAVLSCDAVTIRPPSGLNEALNT